MSAAPPDAAIHGAIDCLRRLSGAFQLRRQQLAGRVGLTEHQWSVLEEVSTEHFMPSMFARKRESSAAAVSKTLRQLVDRGLVSSTISRDDARYRRYVLTAKGKRVMVALRALREEAIANVWSDLDEGDLRQFIRFGSELTDRLETYAGSEGKG